VGGLGQNGKWYHERVPREMWTDKLDGDGLRVEKVRPCRKKETGSGWGKGRRRGGERKKQTFEDDTEGTLADLPANAVMTADEIRRGGMVLGGHGGRGRGRGGVVKIIRLKLTTSRAATD
jgi:hypothetical protein